MHLVECTKPGNRPDFCAFQSACCSPGSNRDLIARLIDSFNLANKTISEQYQVNYLDITGDTRLASTNLLLIVSDGYLLPVPGMPFGLKNQHQ